jgi:hypothetical protein
MDLRGRVHLAVGGNPTVLAGGLRAGLDGVRRKASLGGTVVVAPIVVVVVIIVPAVVVVVAPIVVVVVSAVVVVVIVVVSTTKSPAPVLSSIQRAGRSVLVDRGRLGRDGQTQEGRYRSLHQHAGHLFERCRWDVEKELGSTGAEKSNSRKKMVPDRQKVVSKEWWATAGVGELGYVQVQPTSEERNEWKRKRKEDGRHNYHRTE